MNKYTETIVPGAEGSLKRTTSTLPTVLLLVFGICAAMPLWALATADDELVSLAKSRGKPVIVDFGLGICMQCKKQSATLEEIRETYGDKVIVRMVNVGKEGELTKRYEVELIPTLVFIDRRGKIVLKKVGPLGYDEIRSQLSRMGVK